MPGVHISATNEVAWSISENSSTFTYILFYNYKTGSWRKETIAANALMAGRTNLTLGGATIHTRVLCYANNDEVYYLGRNATDAGSSYTAYRIEPVLSFGEMRKSLINEIWFNTPRNSGGTLDVYYRGDDTVGDLIDNSWSTFGTASLSSPTRIVVRPPASLNTNNRYHQIKWGTDASSDLFSVREIEFGYVPQGKY
jgi:hypothetical protein